MNRIAVLFVALVMSAASAFAILDAYDQNTIKTVLAPTAVSVGTTTNGFVDIVGKKGIGTLILAVGPASTNAADFGCTLSLQHCATTNGTYATVTNLYGGTSGALSAFKIDMQALNRYVRTIQLTTNDVCVNSAVLVYPK